MRWWLLGSILAAVLAEGIILSNLPVLGVKIPAGWMAIYLVMSKEWAGWRQGLTVAALSGYLLDVLAAPVPGSVLVPMLLAWMVSTLILKRYEYSRDSKITAFAAGTIVYLGGSFAAGPHLPGWLNALSLVLVYLVVCAAAYIIINYTVKFWLSRV